VISDTQSLGAAEIHESPNSLYAVQEEIEREELEDLE
jgi:hypothetical protein